MLVLACNSVKVAALLESVISYRPSNVNVIISQDCRNEDVTAIVAQYANGRATWLTVRQSMHHQRSVYLSAQNSIAGAPATSDASARKSG